MNYSVYIIYSESSDLHYIGHTNNLEDRLLRHNSNRNKFTKNKGPWKIIKAVNCNSKSDAYKLELKLKSFKSPKFAIDYLNNLLSLQSIPMKYSDHIWKCLLIIFTIKNINYFKKQHISFFWEKPIEINNNGCISQIAMIHRRRKTN